MYCLLLFLEPLISDLITFFLFIENKIFNERKLNSAIIGTGIRLSYFASIPTSTRALRNNVLTAQKIVRLNKYFIADLEWLDSLLND